MGKAEKRLASLKALLDDAHRRMGLEFGFRLWDGALRPGRLAARRAGDRHRRRGRGREPHSRAAIADPGQSVGRQTPRHRQWRPVRSRRQAAEGAHARSQEGSEQARGAADRAALSCSCRAAGPGRWRRSARTARAAAPKPRTRRTSPITTTSPTPSTSSGSTRRWSTPAPIFTIGATALDAAQTNKLDMICRKLRLKPGETMLDIGSGWGSLACHAAQHYGVKASPA